MASVVALEKATSAAISHISPSVSTPRAGFRGPSLWAPDEGGDQRSSEAIRHPCGLSRAPDEGGHQRSSEAIIGQQRAPVVEGRHTTGFVTAGSTVIAAAAVDAHPAVGAGLVGGFESF